MLSEMVSKENEIDAENANEDEYESMEKMSDIVSVILSEREEERRSRHWTVRSLMMILNVLPTIVGYLCRFTIPLTDDDHWDDRIAMMSCITAPLFILFAFDLFDEEIGNGVEMWHIAIVIGTVLSAVTAFHILQKYKL